MIKNYIDPNSVFPFPLDDFQKQAIEKLIVGESVLVCAPTGSGKTVIAEYAIHSALANNKLVTYTTPLKALSNQKYFDLCRLFGSENVGLITGDQQINRTAPVLVLTTEIFRNILYKPEQEKEMLRDMQFVVLDECHYMKDKERGTVWEEILINAPPNIQLVALSATVGNPKRIVSWMNEVHGKTALILSDFRPVPLRFFFFGAGGLKPLLTPQGKANPSLIPHSNKLKRSNRDFPHGTEVIAALAKREMLPCIYFLFSRKGCDAALDFLASSSLQLLSPDEQRQLNLELDELVEEHPWLKDHKHLRALRKGMAAHHAGMLPLLKSIVEVFFQRNMLKVVFATETLAAGINMPARTVVLSQISKRSTYGHRTLTASEFMQMCGRAGRRGMDEVGYAVTLETPYEGVLEVSTLALSPPEDLISSFSPSYEMVLNLAARHDWKTCKSTVQRSFARFDLQGQIKSLQNDLIQIGESKKKEASAEKRKAKKASKISKDLARLEEVPWRDFELAGHLLQDLDYLDDDHKPTKKGLAAADLRTDNILLTSEVLFSGCLNDLTVPELAGMACALVNIELRGDQWRRTEQFVLGEDLLSEAVAEVYSQIRELSAAQVDLEINCPLPFNPNSINLGITWSLAETWEDFKLSFEQEDGDLVRVLKQAGDLLRQFEEFPASSSQFRRNAGNARALMLRPPVKDELQQS